MSNTEHLYSEYLNYISRNDPSRAPLILAEFAAQYEIPETPALNGIYDKANY